MRNNYGYVSYRGTRRGMGVVDTMAFPGLVGIEAVLDRLNTNIKNNGYATVEEYYKYTNGEVVDGDSEYGWTSLLNCQINRTRYGYDLIMPCPERVVDNIDHLSGAYDALCNDGDIDAALEHLEQLMNK